VSSEKTLEQELADRIREAVRRATPAGAASEEDTSAGPDPLRAAERHAMPTVPPGARLSGVKSALVRAYRFLWRDQAAFNALSLQALGSLRHEQASFRAAAERELSESRRRAAVQDARLAMLEAPQPAAPLPGGPPSAASAAGSEADAIPPAVYSLFEERFRGAPEAIAESQRFYLDALRGAPGPVLDVGCGRGEFLGLLRREGFESSGVDSNPISVRLCREAGLSVDLGDGVEKLSGRPAGSLGAVTALQVVEHWPAGRIFAFLREARRCLRPGGVLVAETVNTDSLSAMRAFFLDPTHVRPVPPAALAFLAEAAGFVDAKIQYRAPLPSHERLTEATENDAKLNRLLFAPQDYALIARAPAGEAADTPSGRAAR
jgi:SAM-dependent methyltransferase